MNLTVSRRRSVGWLDCPVDDFLRLLGQHESGEINLLAEPAELTDGDEDEAEKSEAAEEVRLEDLPPTRALPARPPRNGARTYPLVRAFLLRTRHPVTADRVALATGAGNSSVRTVLKAYPEFVQAGQDAEGVVLWTHKNYA